jgi:hypothetical protein
MVQIQNGTVTKRYIVKKVHVTNGMLQNDTVTKWYITKRYADIYQPKDWLCS